MEKTFLKCMLDHLRLMDEPLGTFRDSMGKLTPKDKIDLKAQFQKEFGYSIPENPQVDRGVAA